MGTLTQTIRSRTLIIGGGPAGSAAAIRLAQAGADVTLIERDRVTQPKVCGEFLSVEACAELNALGIDPLALGAAPIDHVRVTWRTTTVETQLPFTAASLSRAVLDEALIIAAEREGAGVHRATRAITLEASTVTTRRDHDTHAYEADNIVLATGKSELPNQKRTGGHFPDALGFKMHLALPQRDLEALGTTVELTLFPGGYFGLQRIENHQVAFALVITRRAFATFNSWPTLVAHLKSTRDKLKRLTNATELWPKPLAVSGVPYGFTYQDPPTADTAHRSYRVGDQLAVIPSFTGDGLAIALVSGTEAAKAILKNDSPQTFHATMRTRLKRPMLVASALSRAIATPLGSAAVILPASLIPQIFSIVATHTRIPRND